VADRWSGKIIWATVTAAVEDKEAHLVQVRLFVDSDCGV
jgi:hypothetical protein